MIKNRYDEKLREGNQLIIDLSPANYTMRLELAEEIKRIINNNSNSSILEIGSGEGDLTKYILKTNTGISMDCLDISQEMIDSSKKTLAPFIDRIHFIQEDALEYLTHTKKKYDIITSAWTIHNFKRADKIALFKEIYEKLSTGGTFIIMDKRYPEDKEIADALLHLQLQRYKYLDEELKTDIISHEYLDFTDEYRMDELTTVDVLKQIGFKNITIADRIERDILLIAEK